MPEPKFKVGDVVIVPKTFIITEIIDTSTGYQYNTDWDYLLDEEDIVLLEEILKKNR